MDKTKIARINALAKKAKTIGLTAQRSPTPSTPAPPRKPPMTKNDASILHVKT
ncbi:MAG: DUF896 domain-containing protein [Subdoligranulum variabile]|nr:DUF896 domain-containing protein [Subdoligranulum variabile]